MEVYLIRHGRTKGNQEHRYTGRTDEPVLEEALEDLKQKRKNLPAMDWVVTSPYLRCIQTAEVLFGRHGWEPKQVAELGEMDFGAFEYKNYQELNGNPDYQRFIDCGGTIAFPGGEEPAAFKLRCQKAFLKCMEQAEEHKRQRMAFVVHGGTIMAVLEAFAYPPQDYFEYQAGNGEGCRAWWEPERKRLSIKGNI